MTDELEQFNLMQLLREGEVERFNEFRQRHNYKRIDLSGSDFVFVDLSAAILVEADLADSNLSGSTLSGANMKGAFMTNCDLSGAELRGTDLSGADLSGADLSGANLAGANLQHANLAGAGLAGANLAGADLRDADLRRADIRNTVLRSAQLKGTNLDNIQATPGDHESVGLALEDEADEMVKAGQFSEALELYDLADRFLAGSLAFARRLSLFRKLLRLSSPLGLSRGDLRGRGRNLFLALKKTQDDAAGAGDDGGAGDLGSLIAGLGAELGIHEQLDDPASSGESTVLSATDIARHAAVAVRLFHRFDTEGLATRLGEILDAMDETTALDLSVRFHIPDLKLEKRAQNGLDTPTLDRLRGESLLAVMRQRLSGPICAEDGAVHRAWMRSEPQAVEALLELLHNEMKLPSPYRLAEALLAALFVKSGLAAACGWRTPEKQPLIG